MVSFELLFVLGILTTRENHQMKNVLFALAIIAIVSCKSQNKLTTLQLSPTQSIVFLDSVAATKAIVKDEVEHFFEYIQVTDMSIQLKRNFPEGTDRSVVLEAYKDFLQEDVADFNKDEIEFVQEVWNEAYRLSNLVNSSIFPKEIKLIKTHANHYGASVYYTRENCIVIPKYAMEAQNRDAFLSTMLHELFHIYSRYNPENRKALYQLIGFSKIGDPNSLSMVDSLKRRILLNPDGINYAYAITLQDKDDKDFFAIPLIVSNEFEYKPSRPLFFDYLAFNLYKIQPPYSRLIKVISSNAGDPTIGYRSIPSFFTQIRDNTGYIIHPDEIMADNFTYVCFSKDDPTFHNRFSNPGKQLLKDIEAILSE